MDDLSELLRVTCRYLNDNELFYVFTGELACRMLGCTDTVGTVDLVVNLTKEQNDRFLNVLEKEGFTVVSEGNGPMVLRDGRTLRDVRLHPAGSAADLSTLGRRSPVTLGFIKFFISSAEDFILDAMQEKGTWNEEAGRVYLRWRNYLDMEYLIAAARRRGVSEAFIRMKKKLER